MLKVNVIFWYKSNVCLGGEPRQCDGNTLSKASVMDPLMCLKVSAARGVRGPPPENV